MSVQDFLSAGASKTIPQNPSDVTDFTQKSNFLMPFIENRGPNLQRNT